MQIQTLNIFTGLPTAAIHLADMRELLASLGTAGQPTPTEPGATIASPAGTPPASGEYWAGQGGHYICTHPAAFGLPARHLIVGAGEAKDLAWGGYDEDTPGAASQVDGRANTIALLQDEHEHPAAQWAAAYTADGHTDFHLPSRFDLFMCFLHAPQIFSKEGWHSSSSQYSRYDAYCQGFEFGSSYAGLKDGHRRARAVRWIHL